MRQASQLRRRLRIFRHGSAHQHKTPRLGPAVRLRGKLSGRPAAAQFFEARAQPPPANRGIWLGHDHATPAIGFEKTQQFAAEKSGVGPQPHPRARHPARQLGRAPLQKTNHAGVGAGVARTQRAVPELLPLRLETQPRMIRAASLLLGIVTQPRASDRAAGPVAGSGAASAAASSGASSTDRESAPVPTDRGRRRWIGGFAFCSRA